MSHASADFVFQNGTVLYGEYDGTSDVMLSRMYGTPEERQENWRRQVWGTCECGAEPIDCIVHCHYGSESTWPGKACLNCMIFIGPPNDFDFEDHSVRGIQS